ncbi:Kelch motif family protein [Histomonas meleagridis]|uniref:Kelch motif family protein n=1 Tax=Histomonas meleagridis TaxID=135588 RepID=UPI003559CA8E|nr:Kelch motif family protein [Histomonas meleagridis]KAH0802915.1 Kelch motif family protein [Histomonas meleagridis]
MDASLFIAFGRPSQPTIIKELKDVEDKSTSELAEDLKLDKEILAISTPLYREAIPLGIIPFERYPEIANPERPAKFLRPKYFISILPESEKKLFTAFVLVQESAVPNIPPFEVSFVPSDFEGKSFQDFFDFIKSKFPFAMTEPSLFFGENEVSESMTATEIIGCLKSKQLTFKCSLVDKELTKIRHRVNIINEIQITEITYLKGLETLMDYWKPNMESNKLFTEDESIQVFHDFPIIINCHKQFLNNLQQRGVTYGAMLSDVFLDFSSFFKVSLLYISNYSNIIKIILEKSKNKAFEEKLKELTQKNTKGDGPKGELTSYLITPVQRMPRYILFLRELLKATPPSHPDFAMLASAASKLEEVTGQIDQASTAAENNAKLLTIQNSLRDHFSVIHPSRIFKMSIPITYKKPKSMNGLLYLFNDLILFTKESRNNTQSYVYDDLPNTFRYVVKHGTLEFTIYMPVKKSSDKIQQLIFDFPDNTQMNDFIKNLNELKDEFYTKKGIDVSKMFRFNLLLPTKPLPQLHGHCSVNIDNNIYIFGGKSNNTFPTDFIVITFDNESTPNIKTIPTKIPGRMNFSMTYHDKTIYIFGGTTESEYFNDIWEFDILTNKYQQMKSTNTPEARSGHTLTYYNSRLYLIGGINKKNRILDEVCIYDIDIGIWSIIKGENSPSSCIYHTANLINDKIIIHGGMNGRTNYCLDFNIFNTNNNEWEKPNIIGDRSPLRSNHCSIKLKQFIIYIGGSFGTNEITNPGILDTTVMKYTNCLSGINDPIWLNHFSLDIIKLQDKKSLLIYGGSNPITKLHSSSCYLVDIPEYILKILSHTNKRKVLPMKNKMQIPQTSEAAIIAPKPISRKVIRHHKRNKESTLRTRNKDNGEGSIRRKVGKQKLKFSSVNYSNKRNVGQNNEETILAMFHENEMKSSNNDNDSNASDVVSEKKIVKKSKSVECVSDKSDEEKKSEESISDKEEKSSSEKSEEVKEEKSDEKKKSDESISDKEEKSEEEKKSEESTEEKKSSEEEKKSEESSEEKKSVAEASEKSEEETKSEKSDEEKKSVAEASEKSEESKSSTESEKSEESTSEKSEKSEEESTSEEKSEKSESDKSEESAKHSDESSSDEVRKAPEEKSEEIVKEESESGASASDQSDENAKEEKHKPKKSKSFRRKVKKSKSKPAPKEAKAEEPATKEAKSEEPAPKEAKAEEPATKEAKAEEPAPKEAKPQEQMRKSIPADFSIPKTISRQQTAPKQLSSSANSSFRFFQQLISDRKQEEEDEKAHPSVRSRISLGSTSVSDIIRTRTASLQSAQQQQQPQQQQQQQQKVAPKQSYTSKFKSTSKPNFEELYKEFNIDSTKLAPFQVRVLERKLTTLHVKREKRIWMEEQMAKEIENIREKKSHEDENDIVNIYVKLCVNNKIIIVLINNKMNVNQIKEMINEKCGGNVENVFVKFEGETVELNELNFDVLIEQYKENVIQHLQVVINN